MKKRTMALLLVLFMMIAAACGNPAASGQTGQDGAADKEQSPVEGTLKFYTSQPDSDAAKWAAAFEGKHPGVKVETFRSGTEEVISKIKAEQLAGEIQADILLVADSVTFESLKEDDLLMSYDSPEAAEIPEELIDADGTYYGTKVMATALAVNTEKVAEMPTSWNAMISEEAKGKIIMPSPLYSGAAAYNLGVLTRTEGFGWDFYRKVSGNEVAVTKGNGDVLKSVANGDKHYGMVVDFIAARAKADGSPIELVYPREGVPVITEPIGILKDAQNSTAAKAFVDFVLSEEGQQLASELGYTPVRNGVAAPEGLKAIGEIKVISADINELYQSREEDKQEFEKTIGQ